MIFVIGFENGRKLPKKYVATLLAIENTVKFEGIVFREDALEMNIQVLKELEKQGKIAVYTFICRVPLTQEELPAIKREAIFGLIEQAQVDGKKASSIFVEMGVLLIDHELQKLKLKLVPKIKEIAIAEMINEWQYRKILADAKFNKQG
jgi:hypothetical protein